MQNKRFRITVSLIVVLLFGSCASLSTEQPSIPEPSQLTIQIPAQDDWVDHGIILDAGVQGEWDLYLWGGFAFSVIEKDNTFFLYYQGSSDYRTEFDETVLWRSIGVATSDDGIHFNKYEVNPILTWFPNQNGEEGAVSSGVTMDEEGTIFLYYGTNTESSRTTINADARVASSRDGFNFSDLGMVLNHKGRTIWGRGDEIFPVNAIHESGQWIVYYIPNGTSQGGKLGVAYGTQYDKLNRTSMVTSNNQPISVWGTAGHVKLDSETYAVILNNVRERRTEVRLMSPQTPQFLSEPVEVYQFDEVQQATIFLDEEKGTWFMYYRTLENTYGVKIAPVIRNNSASPSALFNQELQ